jgi:hypothetical protein
VAEQDEAGRQSPVRNLLPDLAIIDELLIREGVTDQRAKEFVSQLESLVGKKFRLKHTPCFRILDKGSLEFVTGDDEQALERSTSEEAEELRSTLDDSDSYEVKEWETFSAEHLPTTIGQQISSIRKEYGAEREFFVDRYARSEHDIVSAAEQAQKKLFARWSAREIEIRKLRESEFDEKVPKQLHWPVGKQQGPRNRQAKDYELIRHLLSYFGTMPGIAEVKAAVLERNPEKKMELPVPPLTEKIDKGEKVPPNRPDTILRDAVERMLRLSWRVDVIFNEDLTRPIGTISQNALAAQILTAGGSLLDMSLGDLAGSIKPPILDMEDNIESAAALLQGFNEAVVFEWIPDEFSGDCLRDDSDPESSLLDFITRVLQPGWHIITPFDILFYLTNILHGRPR